MRRATACTLAVLGLLLSPIDSSCRADAPHPLSKHQRPRFSAAIDICVAGDSTQVLLQIAVPYRELSFRKTSAGLSAAFDIIVHVFSDGRQVMADLWPQEIKVAGRGELAALGSELDRELALPLPPGVYEVEVCLDERESGHAARLRLAARVPAREPGSIMTSALLVGGCGLPGGIAELRRDARITRRFTEAIDTLCAYIEVYHAGLSGMAIDLEWELLYEGGKSLAKGSESRTAKGDQTRVSWSISAGGLWIGPYILEARLTTAERQFAAAARFSLLGESDAALGAFFAIDVEVLGYIAGDDELEALRRASAAERGRLWKAFWARRDPTPQTEHNEFKEEFFRRVSFANEAFGTVHAGWRTDRGRTYIVHGEPDRITRGVHPLYQQAMEIWRYSMLGTEFVFVDRGGFGEYQLMESGW